MRPRLQTLAALLLVGVTWIKGAEAAVPTGYNTGAVQLQSSRETEARKEGACTSLLQTADTIFKHLDQAAGLSSPMVSAFTEDRNGFLWIGTQSGVARWDGYRMRTYPIGGDNPLSDGIVKSLFSDSSGRLWVGTNSGGLARYDQEREKFVAYPEPQDAGNHGRVSALLEDGKNGLWVGTDAGLDHLDVNTGQFAHFHAADALDASLKGYLTGRVTSLLRDPDGMLWVGTRAGLFQREPKRRIFREIKVPTADGSPPAVMALLRSPLGALWIGTFGGAYILRRGETVAAPLPSPEGGLDLKKERVVSIAAAQTGVVWLGTYGNGVVAVDEKSLTTWRIRHSTSLPTSLSDDTAQALYRDRSGTVWVGTHRGVNFTNTVQSGIWTIFGGPDGRGNVADTDVFSVLPQEGGTWLGLNHSGVDVLDQSWRRKGRLRPDLKGAGGRLPQGTVNALTETPDGKVYIGTSAGLYRANRDGGELFHVPLARDSAHPADPEITAAVSVAGRLWVGSEDGVWYADKSTGGALTRAQFRGKLTDPRVVVLLGGRGDDLWIGTQSGLNRVDVRTSDVERITPDAGSSSALSSGLITSLMIDHMGRLWVGTFAGLDILEGRDARGVPVFRKLSAGLPNLSVDTLLEGNDGRVWAATDNGMATIDPETLSVKTVQIQDGLGISAYWNNSGARESDGTLVFGGMGGVSVIQPKLLRSWTYLPPVVVTRVRIGDQDASTSSLNDLDLVTPLTLSPQTNRLSVEFAALDYTAPEKNRYSYRLDGFDKDWVSTEATERIAEYTNLPPGSYTLLLRGSNRSGLWATTRRVPVRVLPAWYQTVTFRCILTVIGLLAAGGMYVGMTGVARRRQRELERQVLVRTAELQDTTLKLKESQNKLEQMAFHDGLTGLPNRRMFSEYFRRTLASRAEGAASFGLLMFDLDFFKQINDTHGHDAGDAVLIAVANRLKPLMRSLDCLARLGGDEFALLLCDAVDAANVEAVCNRMVAAFREPILFRDVALRVSLSIGAVLYPSGGTSQDALYKSADLALYRAKHAGKSRWSW